MLGGEHEVGRAEDGVRASGEDRDRLASSLWVPRDMVPWIDKCRRRPVRLSGPLVSIRRGVGDGEDQLGALAPADPVRLPDLALVGPVEPFEAVKEAVGVLGDLEEPLGQLALDDRGAAALAATVDDLLVGEDGQVFGAPVDGRLFADGQPGLEQLDEEPLGPAVVARVAGIDRVGPVEHGSDAAQLLLAVPSGGLGGELHRVDVELQGEVLGVDAEGVEAHRLKDLVAAHPQEPRAGVGAAVRVDMADVEPLGGWVGELHQVVVLRAGRRRGRDRCGRGRSRPSVGATWLDLGGVVAFASSDITLHDIFPSPRLP